MTGTTDRYIEGKVALVTGGAVRIGRALALALAGRGARVALHYGSSAEAAAMAVAAIHDLGGNAAAFQADLRNFSQTVELVDRVAERLGRVDILVNSAATFTPAELADTSESIWDDQFSVNLKAPFFLSRAFAGHVGKERAGADRQHRRLARRPSRSQKPRLFPDESGNCRHDRGTCPGPCAQYPRQCHRPGGDSPPSRQGRELPGATREAYPPAASRFPG